MQVFILLFNARTDNEGIHTLKMRPTDSNSDPQDVVLMFEAEDDATRYALLLEAQDFPPATVEQIDSSEVEEFCQGAGLASKFVPEGTLEVPPEINLIETEWQPDAAGEEPETADADLDRIRHQLEGLL